MEDNAHHRSQTTQSIPLQDLNRPPESSAGRQEPHRRTMSERGRMLFATSASRLRHRSYSPLNADSPSDRSNVSSTQRGDPMHHHQDAFLDDADAGEGTPMVSHAATFQNAVGFAGLRVDDHASSNPFEPSSLPANRHGLNTIVGHNDSEYSLSNVSLDDIGEESPPILDDDRARLTDTGNIQAVDGAAPSTPKGQRHNRLASHTVRFATPTTSPQPSHLGDDLAAMESGSVSPRNRSRRKSSVSRSLSPSSAVSPLTRASTVVRKVSQRVVNLSNEQDVVEQEIRRRSSLRRSREEDEERSSSSFQQHDGSPAPSEKRPEVAANEVPSGDWVQLANPLRGRSLGIFAPDNRIRTTLCDFMTHPVTEPAILVLVLLQTVLLAVEAAPNAQNDPNPLDWKNSWIDWTLLCLFVIYTVEIVFRCIVSGFFINPVEYSTINRQIGWKEAISAKAHTLFAVEHDHQSHKERQTKPEPVQASILRTFTGQPMAANFASDSRHASRVRLAHRAFLRHSFNRLDFVAVVCYWVNFLLAISGLEEQHHVHIFRMLGCLRILRLLSLTSGTSIILRSLKKAAPMLLNVALLISFFWLLFAIVGVQSFKSSLRRNCVWVDPTGQQPNYTTNSYGTFQFCGGSLDDYGNPLPWMDSNGISSNDRKGYLCPTQSFCVSDQNPFNGTVSFDNIFQSLELVFVIITSNTFTDIMYYIADSDYLIAALFFALGLVILTFWLMNLLIAVITSSFQVIREESQVSAFSTDQEQHPGAEVEKEEEEVEYSRPRPNHGKIVYHRTRLLWVIVIAYGIICQCLRSSTMHQSRARFIDVSETVVTLLLLFEILARLAVDWRHFFKSPRNVIDLGLAVITTIIQLPPIHNSGTPYAWLTIFQILRIYRVVLAIPWTRDLIMLVLGKTSGFLNLILFVFLLTFLVAVLASQLFRGEVPQTQDDGSQIEITFDTIFNSFLGMYQIFSSENWTTILYNVTSNDVGWNTAWIGAIFFILWFILGFFIVLSMFIAVIQENFDVSEDEKRLQQVKAFLEQKELGGSSNGTLSLAAMFKFRTLTGKQQDPLDYGPAMTEMLLKDAVVRDFLDETPEDVSEREQVNGHANGNDDRRRSAMKQPPKMDVRSALKSTRMWQRIQAKIWDREPNPFHSNFKLSRAYEDQDARTMAKEAVSAAERRKLAQREYLTKYPTYNKALFIFDPYNPIRRFCQKIVGPGRGRDRAEGSPPSPIIWYAFSAILYAAIVAMVLLACVTTPLYQKQYWDEHHYSIRNWFVFTDMGFAILFSVEAIIRVIADGFFWTPNAYFRSAWGFIDGVVLVTLWINVMTSLYNQGAVSRAVGAFKALRALRLLNISDSARDHFHSVIVRGGWKVVSAAFVSLSLLIPFAIYGLNLFYGQMSSCNDQNAPISSLNDCVNEYMSSPNNWDVLAPRQVTNDWFNFDTFGASLFTLFQIVSQEGWVDVMWRAVSIVGPGQQLQNFHAQGNAVFFVMFNLLGAVFVLTLFVSVFMRNYTEQTGVAFLTTDQRSWLELRKILRQVSPSKRPPPAHQRATWKQWCYLRATRKTGRWQRAYTIVLVFHLIVLCSESYPEPFWYERTRDFVFLALTMFYIVNIIVRIVGLTWTRFRKSSWDLFSIFAIGGTFITTLILLSNFNQRVYQQLHKLFLVSVVLLIIPRNNQLDQLFKTAAASLAAIGNLLATWFVLYLAFAIAFTQTFGLTRFGSNETDNVNFRDVPKALIVLFRCSSGEGWDQLMEDYAGINPPFCTTADDFLNGDCGSTSWARALFILWNILSMYIFVNMFVSLIYESFSYVYQRSSGLSVISRREIRRFKQAWAEFDPNGTGWISKESFPRLLGELSGVFEMRIYPEEFSVGSFKTACGTNRFSARHRFGDESMFAAPTDMDVTAMNRKLDQMPVDQIRARRQRMRVFYEEVMVSADSDRGINFTSLLMVLAHYKVINDNKSLRLEEFLRRRARIQRVEEAVRRDIVKGFFDTVYYRRKFKEHTWKKRSARLTELPSLKVPEIFVEDEEISSSPNTPGSGSKTPTGKQRPALQLDIPGGSQGPAVPSNDFDTLGEASGYASETSNTGLRKRSDSIQISPLAAHGRSRSGSSASPTTNRRGSRRSIPSPKSRASDPPGTDDSSNRSFVGAALGSDLPSQDSVHARSLSVEHARARAGSRNGASSTGHDRSSMGSECEKIVHEQRNARPQPKQERSYESRQQWKRKWK
ncbi:MAG: hypothetical protein Q9162_005188 [Coniocarpon cinnabarinum]